MGDIPRLTVGQTAIRLNVKPATVYAYISRGLLRSQRSSNGSTLDSLEVEEFAQRRRRHPVSSVTQMDGTRYSAHGVPLMVLDTDISHVLDGELYFRGVPVTELATQHAFESVAHWLWSGELRAPEKFTVDISDVRMAGNVVAALPRFASTLDKVSTAVLALGATDPLRYATRENVTGLGARILAGIVGALNYARQDDAQVNNLHPDSGSIASGLRRAFGSTHESHSAGIRALDAALILLVDHDLAISTLAARAAASARATVYGVLSSAMGAMDSELHGNASHEAAELINLAIECPSPDQALAKFMAASSGRVPGFGHALYPEGDPRAQILLDVLQREVPDSPVLATVDSLSDFMSNRMQLQPNIDLALAALLLIEGMPHDAGTAIFAISRSVGWIAHMMNECEYAPMRLRPHGRYVGPAPS
ncbi:citrate synthase [Glutamicibacter sp. X7]